MPALPLGTMVTSRSELLPRTDWVPQPGSILISAGTKGRLLGSEPQPVVTRASEGHAGTGDILIRVTYAVMQDHGVIRDRAAAEGHV